MEIVSDTPGILSNWEALQILREREASRESGPRKKRKDISVQVEEATQSFLDGTAASTQAQQHIEEFLRRIAEFKLTKREVVQLINERPNSLVTVNLLLPEYAARMGDERLEAILDLVNAVFPAAPVKEDEEEGEEGMEEEEGEAEGEEKDESRGDEEMDELVFETKTKPKPDDDDDEEEEG